MENKVYGENYVIKGQIIIDGFEGEDPQDFCFSVANVDKKMVDMMVSGYDGPRNDDTYEAIDAMHRSAIAAICCEDPETMYELVEGVLMESTDYDYRDLDVDEYLAGYAAWLEAEEEGEECEDEFSIYNFLEIESFEYYWKEFRQAQQNSKYNKMAPEVQKAIKQMACIIFNCGYAGTGLNLSTIVSAELVEDASAKTLSGVLTWRD